jgi:prolyl 4-hydroxylase
MRAAELGYEPSQSSLRVLAGGPAGNKMEGEDWAKMRGEIDLAAWMAPPEMRTINDAPRVNVIEKFAPPAACDWLIAQAQGRLSRATIYDKETGGTTEDGRRTNSQCDLDIDTLGVLTFVLRGRIGAITRRQDPAMEIPKILHYLPGETFAEHFDYLDPDEPAFAAELGVRGQRTHTFLIYLNDDFSGGETNFSRIGLSHTGAKGDALLFANVDARGAPDEDTMHAGLPPASGEKWVFSQWIREFPKE